MVDFSMQNLNFSIVKILIFTFIGYEFGAYLEDLPSSKISFTKVLCLLLLKGGNRDHGHWIRTQTHQQLCHLQPFPGATGYRKL